MVLLKGRPYADRRQAARQLSQSLRGYEAHHPLILGIPRGGVVVADTIARALKTDLDIVLTRKLGAPGNPELAIGAVAENGRVQLQYEIAEKVGADEDYIEREIQRQLTEIEARRQHYRQVLPKASLEGRTVILVDDGVATGATMQASLWAARDEAPKEVVIAVPVGAQDAIERLERDADDVICPYVPPYFYAIGQFFADFGQVEDQEVIEILRSYSQPKDDGRQGTEHGERMTEDR
jgi:putative phosphoribosyl transferase